MQPAQFFLEEHPAQQGDENRRGSYDPGRGSGLGSDQTGGLQPLVKGDADKSQQGKITQVFPTWQSKLLAGEHCCAEDNHPDQEAQPHHADRQKFAQGYFGGTYLIYNFDWCTEQIFCGNEARTPGNDAEK